MLLYEPCNSALSCQAHILQQQVADLTVKLADMTESRDNQIKLGNNLQAMLAQAEQERNEAKEIVRKIAAGMDPLKCLVEGMGMVGELESQLAAARAEFERMKGELLDIKDRNSDMRTRSREHD